MEEDLDCPLCMEEMDITDRHLKPCHCGYQICVWCWHQVMENAAKENTEGRCPACRTPYDKDKIVKTRLSCSELEFTASKRKSHKTKSKAQDGRKQHLSNVRVVQRNLVYIVGFPVTFADEETLERRDFFGQYGKILKVAVSRQHAHNGPTASVYVTYVKEDDAVKCINAIDGCIFEGKMLRACFGTNKYCNSWLKNLPCNNPDCLYLHDEGPDEDSYTKEEMIAKYGNKIQFNDLTKPPHRAAGVLPPPVEPHTTSIGQIQQTPNKILATRPASSPGLLKVNNLPPAAAWGMREMTPGKTLRVEPHTDSSQEGSSPVHTYGSSLDLHHDEGGSSQEKLTSDNLLGGDSSINIASDLPNGHAVCSESLSPGAASNNDVVAALDRLDLGVPEMESTGPSISSGTTDIKAVRSSGNEPAESNIISDILTMDFSEDGVLSPGDITKLFLTGRSTSKQPEDLLDSPLSWKPHGKQQSRFSFARHEDTSYDPSTSNQHVLFPSDLSPMSRSQSISSADPAHASTMKSRLFAPPGFSGTSVPPPGFALRSSTSMPPSPAGNRLSDFDLLDPAIMVVGRGPLQNDISRTMRVQHKAAGVRQFFPPTDHGDVGLLARQYENNPLSPYSPSARNYRGVSSVDNSWVGNYSAEALAKFKRGTGGLGNTGVPNAMRPGDGDNIFSNRSQAFDHYMSEQSYQADIPGAFV